MPQQKTVISISTSTILKIVFIAIGLVFLWYIRDVLALLFASLILAAALDPTVDYLQRYKIPRGVSVVLVYIVVFSVVSWVLVGIAGPMADEVRQIATEIPRYYNEVNTSINQFFANSPNLFTDERVQSFRGGLDSFISNMTMIASGNAFPAVSAFFGGMVSFMLALVITFYFIVQENSLKQFVMWVIPGTNEDKIVSIIEKIQKKLGLWLRGQLILSVIIFIITYAGLKAIGVKYALVLAILAGILELIPYLGPIISAVPALFLTLVAPAWGGPFKALLVLILYTLIQQAENNFIVPKVMSKTIGLNPLVVIISMLIGAQVAGVIGLIVAVPIATAATVYLKEMGYLRVPNGGEAKDV